MCYALNVLHTTSYEYVRNYNSFFNDFELKQTYLMVNLQLEIYIKYFKLFKLANENICFDSKLLKPEYIFFMSFV